MIEARAGWWAVYEGGGWRRVEAWDAEGYPLVVDRSEGRLVRAQSDKRFRFLRPTIAAPEFTVNGEKRDEPTEIQQARSAGAAFAMSGGSREGLANLYTGDELAVALAEFDARRPGLHAV